MARKLLHLKTDNGGFLKVPTIQISTVYIGLIPRDIYGELYETAVITNAGVNPIEQYSTPESAIAGHVRICAQYNCHNNFD